MIIVHYKDGKSLPVKDNLWKAVPDKENITAVEVRSDFDGKSYTLRGSEAFSYVFFGQRVGYIQQGNLWKHRACGAIQPMTYFLETIPNPDKNGPKELQALKQTCPKCNAPLTPKDINAEFERMSVVNTPYEEEEVGMVVDKDGACIVLDVTKSGAKVFYTKLEHMGMTEQSFNQLGIDVSRAGDRR